MHYFKFAPQVFVLLLSVIILSNFYSAQDLKNKGSKKNVQTDDEQLVSNASRASLVAVYPAESGSPRFAYPLRDLSIAADITKAIYTDPILSKYDIDFKVKNNWVYLYGKVDLDGAREYAGQVASKVIGVQGVENNIKFYQDTQDNQGAYEKDLGILEDIYSRYESNPIIHIENIHVSVYNGVVRLSGTVNSYLERDLVVSEAAKAGAVKVFDLLITGKGPDTHEIKNSGDFFTWPY